VNETGYSATSRVIAHLPEHLQNIRDAGDVQRMSDELRRDIGLTFSHAVNLSASSPSLCVVSILFTWLMLMLLRSVI